MFKPIRARRRTAVTDYRKRVALLKSRLSRMVVRKSNSAIYAQLVSFTPSGDKVLVSANSNQLRKYGWPARRNIPSAYLTGMLLAAKAASAGIKGNVVLDTGLYRPVKNSVIFAAAKGAADAGMPLLNSIEFDQGRIRGAHIAAYAKALHGTSDKLKKQFGAYIDNKVDAANIEQLFDAAKQQITKA